MRRQAAGLVALGLAGCGVIASAPAPETAIVQSRKPAISNIQVVRSPGGVTAWLVSEPFVPIIAMEMAWRGGAAVEPASKRGLGWVLGYMMNEGAGDMDTAAYGARMEDLNMKFACGVWIDWTSCGMTTLKATASESFDMMKLAFNDLRFDDEPFERAKRELAIGLKADETNPRNVAAKAMNAYLIPSHPYARETTAETVARIAKPDVKAFMKQLMTKDRLLVVVVGDITADELKPRLDDIFGGLPDTSVLPDVADATAKAAPKDPILKRLPLPQTLVTFSGPGVSRDDPDFYAAYTLNYILGGGGFSSRLTDDIREKRGLTYGVGTALSVQPHFWRWAGSSSTMNDKAEEVVARIRENIARLGKDGPTAKELSDAKEYLTGSFPLAFDSNAKIAKNLMSFRQDGMGVDYVEKRNEYFNAVTLEDLRRVAKKYMKPENFTFVLVGSPGD